MVTSSLKDVHGALDIVHLSTYVVPAVPEKVETGLVLSPKLPPAPLTTVHNPVPTVGEFPVRVVDVNPHILAPVWSDPAFAVVGFC